MKNTIKFTAPSHWASALINGDESAFDYHEDEKDFAEYEECLASLVANYGNAMPVDCTHLGFKRSGDFGSLAGDYADYTVFDESK